MTRRERLERKLEKRREWAEKAEQRSGAAFDAARKLSAQIPFGQPILVGHHSERHARRDAERIFSGMGKGVEQAKLAEHHENKADGLERALDRSIFADDEDAVEQIEARLAASEAKRERMKEVNRLYRKKDATGLATLGLDFEALRAKLEAPEVMSWMRIPYPAYALSNLGGRITADRKKLEAVKAKQERTAAAEASPGGFVIEGEDYVRVTFAEKPARELLDALKAAGFSWHGGSWIGRREALPANLKES